MSTIESLHTLRRLVGGLCALTLLWSIGAPAESQVDSASSADGDAAVRGSRGGPMLYYKQNAACLVAPNCQIPGTATYPNPNNYTTLVTLDLPRGSYLIRSKLSAFGQDASGFFVFECALVDVAGDTPLDSSSFAGLFQRTLFLQMPITFTNHAGGSVRVGCRASGVGADGVTLIDMHVWNVDITATAVGSVKMRYQ